MATSRTKTEKTEVKNEETKALAASDLAASLRAEFEAKGAKQVNPDLYFHKFEDEDGNPNPIAGYLLDRRERKKGGEGFYYIIGLSHPTKLWTGDGDCLEGKPGMFAWVDERWCVQSLQAYLPRVGAVPGDVIERILTVNRIAIIPKSKRKIDGGKSVWEADVLAHPVDPSKPEYKNIPMIAPKTNTPPPKRLKDDQADIPF